MLSYILKRTLLLIPLLIGITFLSFVVIKLAPGKSADLLTNLNPKISLEAREKIRELHGENLPILTQYKNWFLNSLRLNFGYSHIDERRVIDKIKERLPITLTINIISIILIFLIGIPLGVISSIKQNSWIDKTITCFVFVGFALPSFWLALILMDFFCIKLGWLPISGLTSLDFDEFTTLQKVIDVSKHLALPIFIYVVGGLAGISRYMRQSMIEVFKKPFLLTARAKGLPRRIIIVRHALKNCLLPIITLLGLSLPALISGSVIIESIFALPGMGSLFFEAVNTRDIKVVMGILTIGAILTMLGNLCADIAYAYVDPRIRYKKS